MRVVPREQTSRPLGREVFFITGRSRFPAAPKNGSDDHGSEKEWIGHMAKGEQTRDYSQTLNLPKTDFPMRGNLPQAEPKMQAWWDGIDRSEEHTSELQS